MTDTSAPTVPSQVATVAVIGGGPAGLMAAEVLSGAGLRVDVFDAMPSVGRKFLLAGKGGLNLTHAEALPQFVQRYGARTPAVTGWLERLSPLALRDWAAGLGITTFVGSSGKVFPAEMKAAPLLRAWLHRLRAAGVSFHMRHRWQPASLVERGAQGRHRLHFESPAGESWFEADAVLLALGGASWSRLGSDGLWASSLVAAGVEVAAWQPSNCGFDVGWSEHLAQRHAGAPLKSVRLGFTDADGVVFDRLGEAVLTATGLEGNLIYAASAALRELIARDGSATVALDLLPARPLPQLVEALARGRGARSLANHLREQAGLSGVKAGLLREGLSPAEWSEHSRDAAWLAARIKALPVQLRAARPIDEAISSAGGVRLEAMTAGLELLAQPGVFCAGEMLDWEAPTGGYLLTAALASGRVAAQGLLQALARRPVSGPPAIT
jgi:uncharacterized flavoprotein (TIGR03862 family)